MHPFRSPAVLFAVLALLLAACAGGDPNAPARQRGAYVGGGAGANFLVP